MPTDLLLASFSSCYALALAWAARKRGVDLPDLVVTATGAYAGQRFGALTLTVRTSAAAEVVTPLLESARRVCYVSNTLAGRPDISVHLALHGHPAMTGRSHGGGLGTVRPRRECPAPQVTGAERYAVCCTV